jgi:ABC-2 type transport system permease protein
MRLFLLLRLSLKRTRLLLTITGLLLAFIQVLRVNIAAALHEAGQFDQVAAILPDSIRKILGSALGSIMTFNGIVLGVYFDTGYIIAILAIAITLATLPASEIESGFADLILARPLPRHWLITRTITLLLIGLLIMLLSILAGTCAGLALFAPADALWPSAQQTATLALSLAMLVLAWSGVALALAAACRRAVASATTSLLAFGALILDWAHRLWPPLDWIAWLSPFYYFNPYDLVDGAPLRYDNLLVLWAIAMTGFILAYLFLSQREISR